ncbi:hypothetical protein [Spirosoma sp.]|uniref:hypothetical protein n=1 Tax=Spirosoma sp. TaxID=1899569 RepID=UPI00260AE946|nr:hypothetical protein [Spirosoma sp.]MCX6216416.1 hypothetical protein [Spirosoma sp.]
MIDIRIDGESADLLPTTSLTLERFNPLLDFDQIQGSRVYGFDLPDTPTNRRLLGYFYQDQVGYQTRIFRCEKYVHGQLIEQGFVMIRQVEPTFSLYFTQNLGEIFGDSQKLLLSKLSLGNDVIAPLATANHLMDRYCFPTIQNDAFYGNQAVEGFTGLINQYTLATGYNPTARVPMPFVKWVFQQFGNLTGWTFTGQFWQDPDLCRLIFYNLFSLDGQNSINSNNHLPDLTLSNVLIDLRKLFNLYLEFDVRRNICTMDFGNEVINSGDILDWTDKAHPKHVKAPDLVNRLELSYDIDSNDALMKPVPPAMDSYTTPETTINEGGTTVPIKSRFSTLLTDPLTGRAVTQQAGISPNNKDSKTNTTPKFLFWHGVVNDQPLATSAHGNRSLNWHGPNNLVDAGYKRFEAFKGNTFSVNKLVFLSPADLALFSFRKKVHIKGVNYVVGSMKAALGNDRETIPTEVSLARI